MSRPESPLHQPHDNLVKPTFPDSDNARAFLYILFEHQNQKDPLIGLRLLTCMVRIWKGYLRKNRGATKLPAVPPLVLAQDNKPRKSSTRFADLIDIPEGVGEEIKKHIPDFEFQLVELYRLPFAGNYKHCATPNSVKTPCHSPNNSVKKV